MRAEERARIARMLEANKEEINGETKEAALKDFLRVAAEYFEVSGEPVFEVERKKNGFFVTFSVEASRVKNFTSLCTFRENL